MNKLIITSPGAVKKSAAEFELTLDDEHVLLNNRRLKFDIVQTSGNYFHVLIERRSYRVSLIEFSPENNRMRLLMNDQELQVVIRNETDMLLEKLGLVNMKKARSEDVLAPMPGLIVDVGVEVGQDVKKGDKLLVLNAMKMENIIKAPADGKIRQVLVQNGQNVEKNQLLIQF